MLHKWLFVFLLFEVNSFRSFFYMSKRKWRQKKKSQLKKENNKNKNIIFAGGPSLRARTLTHSRSDAQRLLSHVLSFLSPKGARVLPPFASCSRQRSVAEWTSTKKFFFLFQNKNSSLSFNFDFKQFVCVCVCVCVCVGGIFITTSNWQKTFAHADR
jgi:hypothetical protein